MEKRLVSIVIPTYNRCAVLCKCIDSILDSTYDNFELIIVDNASIDETVCHIASHYKDERIQLIKLKKNLMAAGGRNEGIKKAKGDYVLFIDNDNIIAKDMIEILVREMDTDQNIGLVGPLSLNKVGGDTIWMASGDYNYWTSKPRIKYNGLRVEEVKLEKRYETKYSPNIFMVRKAALEAVGGLDPFYGAMYEEADFGIRINKAGYRNYIVTDARTSHLGAVGDGEQRKLRALGIESPERAYCFARNRSVFQKKYASGLQLMTYFFVFIHVFTIYYCYTAIKEQRKDIALAWFKGTVKGVFSKTSRDIFIKI